MKEQTMDFSRAVMESVEKEYDEFRTEMINSPSLNVFHSHYQIYVYTEHLEVIQTGEYLPDEDYQTLCEDIGHILESLYNYCLCNETADFNTYADTARHVHSYCELKREENSHV